MTEQIPVQKNDEIELHIEDLTHEAYGVGRYQGYTLFVKGALPGEVVKAKILKTKKRYGYAKKLALVESSPARRAPSCLLYGKCGGCQLQHLSYAEQLKFKENLVRNDLERIGGFDLREVLFHPIIGMKEPWRYRNKSQVPIGEKDGGLIGGFYRDRSHDIIDMNQCLIQHEQLDQVVQTVKELGTKLGIPAYDEVHHTGFLRHVVAKYGFSTDQLMIVLVTNGKEFPAKKALISALKERFSNLKSIVQNINTKRTNVIFGDESIVLWGEPYIYDHIGPIRFAISARSFFQVNPVQTKVLYDAAIQFADLKGEETVIDAYCGIGTISLFLAQKAKQVYGVEVVPEAVEDAKRNAALNGMNNVHFEAGKAEEVIPRWKEEGIGAEVIVVDPPRKGCDRTLLDTILDMRPKRVVYVSCNPATLARDLNILTEGGYQLKEVQPVDMFPQTVHVESVAKMVLKEEA